MKSWQSANPGHLQDHGLFPYAKEGVKRGKKIKKKTEEMAGDKITPPEAVGYDGSFQLPSSHREGREPFRWPEHFP